MVPAMRKYLPMVAMAAFYIFVQAAAVLLAPLFLPEYAAFPDPNNVVNPLIYVFLVLVVTGIILILIKFGRERIVQAIFFVSVFITIMYVFLPLFLLVDHEGYIALIASLALAGGMIYALAKSGEWYIINAVGLVLAIGVTAILGMSLGILPVIILLVIMAVYDAISVYKTKHMVALAEGVAPLRLPVLFVIPKDRGFKMDSVSERGLSPPEGGEREAFFMGLGDTVIPGILVVSASMFLPETPSLLFTANIWVAIGTIVGGLLGYLLLMRFVLRGRPQAGLPFLNTGAILGYLATYILVFQSLGLQMLGL
ncbi:presenilin family intramembrane aspartyl protease PSH [Methanomassiliicoccus luminyensis]|uniref:presenilin family intramembrane aspartyl protease PSH n=2 Tax=Methanomassiliicoccus luminyensis TaxID=1080712 RepID=UPI0009D9B552|nr:presenilin family intramembrane aspartyl protease PSH [Methanomassiliicoccus luminyensis]